jgi:hypothetical protein
MHLTSRWKTNNAAGGPRNYGSADVHQYALMPAAKAINVLSGETAHPPEPVRSKLMISDLTSSSWRIQSVNGKYSCISSSRRHNFFAIMLLVAV